MKNATSQLRILVIDDNAEGAEALCALLGTWGCKTAVAFDGTKGIATAASFDPHLAFIDLEMPGMGGYEVARHLRASHSNSNPKLICLAGRGQPDTRRTCIEVGFDNFFTKPMAPQKLARVVAAACAAL